MLRKLAIFNARKYVHMEAFFGITYWEPMPDGVICIRSKIACLELDEKINELWYEVTMYR